MGEERGEPSSAAGLVIQRHERQSLWASIGLKISAPLVHRTRECCRVVGAEEEQGRYAQSGKECDLNEAV